MLYIYRTGASNGARDLADGMNINARRINDLNRAHYGNGVRAGDKVVCWGDTLNPIEGVQILNGSPMRNKYEDALLLKEKGIATVEVANTPQRTGPAEDPARAVWAEVMEATVEFTNLEFARTPVTMAGVEQFQTAIARLKQSLQTPLPPQAVWLPRRFHHVGGNDLLTPPFAPQFWSKKETIANEYRIHSFMGKSIRAGVKTPREGVTQHPWVRSYDGGWYIRYDGFDSTKAMRNLAHGAVAALGLDFGAVDIAQRPDGSMFVLEVNRAPGLEGGTIVAYAQAIEGWARGN